MTFGRGSVGRGVLEEGKFGRFVSRWAARHEGKFVCFVSPWAARHEGKFVCFVVSITKQLRAASVSGWAHGGGWREADSLAFTTKLASVPVWLRPVLKPDSYHSRAESRSKVGQIRLWCWSFSEAPSWLFGEASPNDSEGASVAFMARTCCASDHESSSVAFVAGFRRAVMKGLKRPSLGWLGFKIRNRLWD